MITNLPREQLVSVGRRVWSGPLIDQAAYTLSLAAADRKVAEAVGGGFLEEAHDALEALKESRRDRRVVDERTRSATLAVERAIAEAQRWCRMFVRRAKTAHRRGLASLENVSRVTRASDVPGLAGAIEGYVATGREHAPALAAVGITASLLEKGEALARRLRELDNRQELLKRGARRDAVTRQWEQTALVYIAVKHVIDIAYAVHAGDRRVLAQYALSILHGAAVSPPPATAPPEIKTA